MPPTFSPESFVRMALASREHCRWREVSVEDFLEPLRVVCRDSSLPTIPFVICGDNVLESFTTSVQQLPGLTATTTRLEGATRAIVALTPPLPSSDIFAHIESFAYIADEAPDPFLNGPVCSTTGRLNIKPSQDALMLLGELMSYAGRVFAAQSRQHFFTVVLFGTYARLIRWDRSQALVSSPLDCTLLEEFYALLSTLTRFQRGADMCVAEEDESVDVRKAFACAPADVQARATCEVLWRLALPGDDAPRLIVLAPILDSNVLFEPFCRNGTINDVRYAFDVDHQRFLVVRDSFLRVGEGDERLSDIYACFGQSDVPNVPRLVWRGDLPAITSGGLVLHRFVLDAALADRDLASCKDAEELMGYMLDLCRALQEAAKLGIHHGRVCPKNIRICDGHAVLINWEPRDNINDGRLFQYDPTDTDVTQYRSISSLRCALRTPSLEDDRQAVLWVFLDVATRLFASDISLPDPSSIYEEDAARAKQTFLHLSADSELQWEWKEDVEWLQLLLEDLCEAEADRQDLGKVFQRYVESGREWAGVEVESGSGSGRDVSEERTLYYAETEESDGSETTLEGGDEGADKVTATQKQKRKADALDLEAEEVENDPEVALASEPRKRTRHGWDYVFESAALKAPRCTSPTSSTVYCPLSPEFLPVINGLGAVDSGQFTV